MRAVVWHGKEDLRVEEVPDPRMQEPTDALVRITASAICGSDLHLYNRMIPVGMKEGDILGHEPVGVVEEVGADVSHVRPGDKVVIPFNVSCGRCFMCRRGMQSQCETTQNRAVRKGGSLFGYTHLYGGIPGGQAEYLRVPMAHYGPIPAPDGVEDHILTLLADVLPTSWQAVAYGEVGPGDNVGVWGLGPIGQMCARIALHRGAARVIGVDPVEVRREMARRNGVEPVDPSEVGDVRDAVREMTDGRGVDVGIDAVGLEATGTVLDRAARFLKVQVDRTNALRACMGSIRRGGVLSIVGVYIGVMHLFPIGSLFDKQIAVRMGQANVRRWTDEIVPLLVDPSDPLGLKDLVTHVLPLEAAPDAYRTFRDKDDGAVKIVLTP